MWAKILRWWKRLRRRLRVLPLTREEKRLLEIQAKRRRLGL